MVLVKEPALISDVSEVVLWLHAQLQTVVEPVDACIELGGDTYILFEHTLQAFVAHAESFANVIYVDDAVAIMNEMD